MATELNKTDYNNTAMNNEIAITPNPLVSIGLAQASNTYTVVTRLPCQKTKPFMHQNYQINMKSEKNCNKK